MAAGVERLSRTGFGRVLDLPPLFRLVTLREAGNAFAHARAIAAEEGAGTLVWVGRFDVAEFAVVLEPDEPLRSARRAIFAGLAALADALAVHAPPERPIEFDFPATLKIDEGLAGGGQLGWPAGTKEDQRPDWLVFGAMIRTNFVEMLEPGQRSHVVGLDEEGFEDFGSGRLVESFARHLMVHMDAWQTEDFGKVAEAYLQRLPREKGIEHMLDGFGDLLIRRKGKVEVEKRKLLPAIERPLWLDHKTGGILE
jgi:hypothetical protein